MAYITKAERLAAEKAENERIERKQIITIVIISAFIIIGLGQFGIFGRFLYQLQRYLFGNLFWLILIFVIVSICINMINRRHGVYERNILPLILMVISILLLTAYFTLPEASGMSSFLGMAANIKNYFGENANILVGGGFVGNLLFGLVSAMLGRSGVLLISAVLIIIVMLLVVSLDVYKKAFHAFVNFFTVPEEEEYIEEEDSGYLEAPKETPNLWRMVHKKNKPKSFFGSIDADDNEKVKEDDTNMDFVTLKNEHPKAKEKEILAVRIPPRLEGKSKVQFIDIDDLRREELQEYEEEEIPEETYEEEYVYADDYDGDSYEEEVIDEEEEVYDEDEYVEEEEEEYEEVEEDDSEEEVIEEVEEEKKPIVKKKKEERKHGFKNYHTPIESRVTARLLEDVPRSSANDKNEQAAAQKGEALLEILKTFDIEAKLVETHIGPSVTQFEIKPDVNVKVNKIIGLTDNIKMQLAAKDVRIEAPIPGRPTCGIEIPNAQATLVKMKELFNDRKVKEETHPLMFVVGKDLQGGVVTCRLDKMPHLLIAGATGSGKSVCMNSIICSILLRAKPDQVKLLLVDPKKVEFTPYHDIPHLIGPVINDANKASNALKIIVQMMDERYNVFSYAGVRNIEGFNEKVRKQGGKPNEDGTPAPKPLPYIVVIIDELADLMSVAGKDVESSIQRITQLARAAGIHLIVATQRPSVNVITGVIKSNIPSRIAFAVSSGIDSRTILDSVGAERLLGHGDMLYMPIGQNAAERVQGVFVTDEEVQAITEDVKKRGKPEYDDHFIVLDGVDGNSGIMSINDDPMFEEIKEYVIEAQKASTSLLQRRFGIGYNRAAKVIDALEASGIIGPAQGSKPREVYIKKGE